MEIWKEKLTKDFLIEQYVALRKSMQIIANEIKCNIKTVNFYLDLYNIERRTLSESHKGIKFTEKTKQKMRDNSAGKKRIGELNPMFGKLGKDNPNYGSKRTEETCQKMSDSAKNKPKATEGTCQKMSDAKKGVNHPRFKGRRKNDAGYILIYSPDHPNKTKNNSVRESRLIVEAQMGRYLLPEERVHHINKIKDDNRIENLICFTSESAHQRFHHDPNNVKELEIIFDGRKLL